MQDISTTCSNMPENTTDWHKRMNNYGWSVTLGSKPTMQVVVYVYLRRIPVFRQRHRAAPHQVAKQKHNVCVMTVQNKQQVSVRLLFS